MSTLKVNSIEPANAGSEDYFLARAWVSFNGTGTVAIRADGNVSSITDNGTGDYTVTLSSASVDDGYSVSGSVIGSSQGNFYSYLSSAGVSYTTSAFRSTIIHYSGAFSDQDRVHAEIVR